MNKLVCIGLITLSALSCSVSRDNKQRLYKHEKDSLSAIRIDHLFRQAKSDSRNHLSATLRQVTFSSPRQFRAAISAVRDHRHPARTIPAIGNRHLFPIQRPTIHANQYRHARIAGEQGAKKTGDPLVAMASAGPCPHRDSQKNDLDKIKTHPMNHKRNKYQKRINIQLTVAVMLCLAGLSLLFMGFWCSPTGEIHNSVLIGFGEVSTFAGALFGVDYKYKEKRNY